jgi:hypothetical protein
MMLVRAAEPRARRAAAHWCENASTDSVSEPVLSAGQWRAALRLNRLGRERSLASTVVGFCSPNQKRCCRHRPRWSPAFGAF